MCEILSLIGIDPVKGPTKFYQCSPITVEVRVR